MLINGVKLGTRVSKSKIETAKMKRRSAFINGLDHQIERCELGPRKYNTKELEGNCWIEDCAGGYQVTIRFANKIMVIDEDTGQNMFVVEDLDEAIGVFEKIKEEVKDGSKKWDDALEKTSPPRKRN